MTEDDVISIINKVANRLANRFKFGYHDIEDMKQQARLFALEALSSYDEVRPLENFLWTHVHNRLFNFKRDKYERIEKPCLECEKNNGHCIIEECDIYNRWLKRNKNKKNLMNPIDITNIDDDKENNMKLFHSSSDSLNYKEMLKIIDKELPISLRPLYLKLKFGIKMTKTQKTKIQTIIKTILEEHGYGQ